MSLQLLLYPLDKLLFYAVNGITELVYRFGLGGMAQFHVPLLHVAFFAVCFIRPELRDYHLRREHVETDYRHLRPSYDYIIVGGGISGCLAANRLSRHHTVLLVHGPGAVPNIVTRVPLLNSLNQGEESHDFEYKAEPSSIPLQWQTGGITYNSGKTLGGASILGALIYSLARKADLDRWAIDFGIQGFDHDTLTHYVKMHTRAQGDVRGLPMYGTKGDFFVDYSETPKYYQKYKDAFLKAATYVTGTSFVRDHNEQWLGFGSALQLVEKHTGFLSSPVRALIENIAKDQERRGRLHIILESMVERIGIVKKFGGGLIARGVIVKMSNAERKYFFARKKVILAAGAVRTPQILMLSGVGPMDELTKWQIPVLLNREGVGRNLHDHYDIGTSSTLFPRGKGYADVAPSELLEFFLTSKGAIRNSYGVNSLGFFKSRNISYTRCHTQATCQPDFEIFLHTVSVNHPIGGSTLRAAGIGTPDLEKYYYRVNGGNTLIQKDGILMTPTLLHPVTRGRIKLRDLMIESNPRIYLNVLDNERDVQMAAELYLTARKIGITAFGPFGGEWMDVRQEGCTGPDDSFEYARCAVKRFLKTAWHLAGTARLGHPHDPFAVVDSNFNVIGVENLAIIDASIMPAPVSGHMLATIAAYVEKFCDMVHRGII